MLAAGAPAVPARRAQVGTLLLAALIVAAAAWVVLGVALRRDYNHDEHQFIAAGALIAREGLLPYRDFAYFHAPTLALLYAALYRVTDQLLLAARLLNVAAAAGMVALLLGVSLARLQALPAARRLLAGGLVILLLLATPAFLHAAGRAWNHDLPVLLALAAFLAQLAALEGEDHARRGQLWSGAAGLLIGLAAGMRLTYAPLALPLLLGPLLWRIGARRLLALTAAFVAGLLLGLLPVFVLFVQAPDAFLFGNLTYARLNTEWYRLAAGPQAASLARKLTDAAQIVLLQPGNALLVAATLLALLRVRGWRTARDLHLWLILWPFLLLGALAPTPAQLQYVYVLFPFLALGLLLALGHDPRPGWMLTPLAIAAAVAVALALPRLAEGAATVVDRSDWYPQKAHTRGRLLADLAASGPPGSVITLAPALALEGGAPIDPRTATGPFAWRIAPLLAPEERARYKILGAGEFDALEPAPRALLTGLHGADAAADAEADTAQVAWARARGYIPVALPEEGTLWLSPVATWGDRIALAAHTFPRQPVDPAAPFLATLYLQATAPLDRDYNLLLRGVTPDGAEVFRFDGWPYGSPTSTWAVGDVWPDGHTITLDGAALAGAQVVRAELSFYDPATLETLGAPVLVAWLHVGPDSWGSGPAVTFDGHIALQEATPGEVSLANGQLRVPLRWRARDRVETAYTAFVHVLDANGTLIAQRDQQPLGGFYPTQAWRPGRTVEDVVVVDVPPGAAFPLRLLVGLYDPATGQRLPLDGGGDAFAYAEVAAGR